MAAYFIYRCFCDTDSADEEYAISAGGCLPACAGHSVSCQSLYGGDAVVTFINVGQGDAILIELPNRRGVYLIDTGGLLRFSQEPWKERRNEYEVGAQVVVPYLKGKGIAAIDKLIITHADADHVEGAEEVVKEIRAGEIHITPGSYKKGVMKDLLQEAKKQKSL